MATTDDMLNLLNENKSLLGKERNNDTKKLLESFIKETDEEEDEAGEDEELDFDIEDENSDEVDDEMDMDSEDGESDEEMDMDDEGEEEMGMGDEMNIDDEGETELDVDDFSDAEFDDEETIDMSNITDPEELLDIIKNFDDDTEYTIKKKSAYDIDAGGSMGGDKFGGESEFGDEEMSDEMGMSDESDEDDDLFNGLGESMDGGEECIECDGEMNESGEDGMVTMAVVAQDPRGRTDFYPVKVPAEAFHTYRREHLEDILRDKFEKEYNQDRSLEFIDYRYEGEEDGSYSSMDDDGEYTFESKNSKFNKKSSAYKTGKGYNKVKQENSRIKAESRKIKNSAKRVILQNKELKKELAEAKKTLDKAVKFIKESKKNFDEQALINENLNNCMKLMVNTGLTESQKRTYYNFFEKFDKNVKTIEESRLMFNLLNETIENQAHHQSKFSHEVDNVNEWKSKDKSTVIVESSNTVKKSNKGGNKPQHRIKNLMDIMAKK